MQPSRSDHSSRRPPYRWRPCRLLRPTIPPHATLTSGSLQSLYFFLLKPSIPTNNRVDFRLHPVIFPSHYSFGCSAEAGSPGDRDPVSKGIHPATPHPGRWRPTALTSLFLLRRQIARSGAQFQHAHRNKTRLATAEAYNAEADRRFAKSSFVRKRSCAWGCRFPAGSRETL
jgi:hypothetical protein